MDASQVIRTVQLNPRIAMKPKFLLRTGFFPKPANPASSREADPGVTGSKGATCGRSFSAMLLEAMVGQIVR